MKAIDAVVNLRKLADLLEKHGDVDIQMASASVWFESKESFIAIARDFPRPFTTEFGESEHGSLTLAHGKEWKTGGIVFYIRRSDICEMIEPARPAKFSCPSILSPEEEVELGKMS